MTTTSRAPGLATPPAVSHNLVGQRLGRKGQETRERILTGMLTLLADPDGPPVTLTAVAKEASVGMTTLYLYFPDMGDLLLAALRTVMGSANEAFMDRLRTYWPDDRLGDECREFHRAHYRFWRKHARLLQMRNSFADACDMAVLQYRAEVTRPLLGMLTRQMGCGPDEVDTPCAHLATVALVGIERVATVVTTPHFHITSQAHGSSAEDDYIDNLICAQARVVELIIRQQRASSA
jgi:AcrR family transcriptional regulator